MMTLTGTPLVTVTPLLPSMPEAVRVKSRWPAPVAEKVHWKTPESRRQPGRPERRARLRRLAVPAPLEMKLGLTVLRAAWPVLLMARVSVKSWLTLTLGGLAAAADRQGRRALHQDGLQRAGCRRRSGRNWWRCR